MAKKIVAVTGIKHSEGFIAAGEDIDPSKFSREELRSLLDAGAVLVENGAEEVKTEEPAAEAKPEAVEEKTEEKPATPTKATTAKK